MTNKTKAEITSRIASDFANNTSGAITPALVRTFLTDLNDSYPNPEANGLVTRSAAGTTLARTITAGTGIGVTNGDGVSGNPTVEVTDAELLAIAGLTSAAGMVAQFTGSGAAQLINVSFGTYTPTLVNVTNIDSTTGGTYRYFRIGDCCVVFGFVTVDPTAGAGAATRFRIPFPIASDINSAADVGGGIWFGVAQRAGRISGDTTNNEAQVDFVSEGTASIGSSFIFAYGIE